jgi:hypothetical protein
MTKARHRVVGMRDDEQVADSVRNLKRTGRQADRKARMLAQDKKKSEQKVKYHLRRGDVVAAKAEAKNCAQLNNRYGAMNQTKLNATGVAGNLEKHQLDHKIMEETAKATGAMTNIGAQYSPGNINRLVYHYQRNTEMAESGSEIFNEGLNEAHEVDSDDEDYLSILNKARSDLDMQNMEHLQSVPNSSYAAYPVQAPVQSYAQCPAVTDDDLEAQLNSLMGR